MFRVAAPQSQRSPSTSPGRSCEHPTGGRRGTRRRLVTKESDNKSATLAVTTAGAHHGPPDGQDQVMTMARLEHDEAPPSSYERGFSPALSWWRGLDLNQRPSGYELHFGHIDLCWTMQTSGSTRIEVGGNGLLGLEGWSVVARSRLFRGRRLRRSTTGFGLGTRSSWDSHALGASGS
jgi:hypothetical protein